MTKITVKIDGRLLDLLDEDYRHHLEKGQVFDEGQHALNRYARRILAEALSERKDRR